MDLLINSTDELREYLGFIDVDISFDKIKAKIILASNELIDLIGDATYQLAITEYKKEASANNKNTDFIFNSALPIAIQAYRKFAPHNDVSHTNKGRINRIGDHEKTPFDWMIDNDNEAMERSYYEALDNLIKYLDKNIASWKETEFYKRSHGLFIDNATTFDDIFPIGKSRLLFLKLAPGIRRIQESAIKSRLGTDLYNSLLNEIKTGAVTNTALLLKVREICVSSSMAWAMRRFSVQLFPNGVLQGFVSDRLSKNASKPAENNEAFVVAHYHEMDETKYLLDLEQMVGKLNRATGEEVEKIEFNPNPDNNYISL